MFAFSGVKWLVRGEGELINLFDKWIRRYRGEYDNRVVIWGFRDRQFEGDSG